MIMKECTIEFVVSNFESSFEGTSYLNTHWPTLGLHVDGYLSVKFGSRANTVNIVECLWDINYF